MTRSNLHRYMIDLRNTINGGVYMADATSDESANLMARGRFIHQGLTDGTPIKTTFLGKRRIRRAERIFAVRTVNTYAVADMRRQGGCAPSTSLRLVVDNDKRATWTD